MARKQELVDLSDEVWERLWRRLDGMTDDEYLWEPAPGCWTIRQGVDGSWRHDWVLPPPDPAPVTTLAWRVWHLTDMYGENRAPEWLDIEPQGAPIGLDDPTGAPAATATEALALLAKAHDRWDAHLAIVSEASLDEPIGPVGGAYAEHSRAGYVLHMLDEFIHHGAEVSLLRDLWRWQVGVDLDTLSGRAMRGDPTLVGDIETLDGAVAADLLRTASSYARWDLVTAFVEAGVPVAAEGRTPLHQAAIVGHLALVQLLVDHGADPTTRDPEFGATPQEWARFTGQEQVARWLEALGSS